MFALNEQQLVMKLIVEPFFLTVKVEGEPVQLLIDSYTGLGVTLILDNLCSPENQCFHAVRLRP